MCADQLWRDDYVQKTYISYPASGSHNGGGPNAVGRWQASHPGFSLGMLENSYWRAAVGLLMNMGRYSVHSIYLLEIRAFILLRNLKV